MNDGCQTWDIDERFRQMFPNGLTQEQIDTANQEMWKDNTFYCGSCNKHIPISEYPHECSTNQG